MNLRCVFHVSPSVATVQAKPLGGDHPRMPSLLDLDVEFVDEPLPRGRSFETWTRARGWSSED